MNRYCFDNHSSNSKTSLKVYVKNLLETIESTKFFKSISHIDYDISVYYLTESFKYYSIQSCKTTASTVYYSACFISFYDLKDQFFFELKYKDLIVNDSQFSKLYSYHEICKKYNLDNAFFIEAPSSELL